jgi:rhodanese-related sulfurtransferase
MRLARVGYDKVKGYLNGGVTSWKSAGNTVKRIHSVTAQEFANSIQSEGTALDVRNESELLKGKYKDAVNVPLNRLQESLNTLNKNAHYFVYCQGGYRSMIGTSILEKNGFTHLTNVEGGMNAIQKVLN